MPIDQTQLKTVLEILFDVHGGTIDAVVPVQVIEQQHCFEVNRMIVLKPMADQSCDAVHITVKDVTSQQEEKFHRLKQLTTVIGYQATITGMPGLTVFGFH